TLTIDHAGATLSLSTSGSLAPPANLTVAGGLTNSGTVNLDVASNQGGSTLTVGGTLINSGTLQVNNGSPSSATVISAGAVVNRSYISLEGGSTAAPTLSAAGDFTNFGTFNLDAFSGRGNSKLTIGGTLTNVQTLTFGNAFASGPTSATAAALANTGSIA